MPEGSWSNARSRSTAGPTARRTPENSDNRICYQFSHERIQQAAYTLLNTSERRRIHTSIGQKFLQSHREDTEDNIFEIVNQLRGDVGGDRQVPDADVGLTHNVGGIGQYTFVNVYKRD